MLYYIWGNVHLNAIDFVINCRDKQAIDCTFNFSGNSSTTFANQLTMGDYHQVLKDLVVSTIVKADGPQRRINYNLLRYRKLFHHHFIMKSKWKLLFSANITSNLE